MTAAPSTAEQFEKVKTIIFPSAARGGRGAGQEVKGLIEERARGKRPSRARAGHRIDAGAILSRADPAPPRRGIEFSQRDHLQSRRVSRPRPGSPGELRPVHARAVVRSHRYAARRTFTSRTERSRSTPSFEQCQAYEDAIDAAGGIDLQILGIGRTGHIGFNEPGSTRDSRTRLIALDRLTRQDAAADFLGEANVPRFAITMGVGTILRRGGSCSWRGARTRRTSSGEAVEGPETEAVSASFLQSHRDETGRRALDFSSTKRPPRR